MEISSQSSIISPSTFVFKQRVKQNKKKNTSLFVNNFDKEDSLLNLDDHENEASFINVDNYEKKTSEDRVKGDVFHMKDASFINLSDYEKKASEDNFEGEDVPFDNEDENDFNMDVDDQSVLDFIRVGDVEELLAECNGQLLQRKDAKSLAPRQWFLDGVLTLFAEYLQQRSNGEDIFFNIFMSAKLRSYVTHEKPKGRVPTAKFLHLNRIDQYLPLCKKVSGICSSCFYTQYG